MHPFRKHFEELAVGDSLLTHRRTVSEADIVAFGGISGDFFYMHFDEIAARESAFGKRIAHGYFVLSAAAGLFVSPAPGPVLANYGLDTLRFVKPVAIGDTIRARLTCKRKIDRNRKDAQGRGPGRRRVGRRGHQPGRRDGRELRHPDAGRQGADFAGVKGAIAWENPPNRTGATSRIVRVHTLRKAWPRVVEPRRRRPPRRPEEGVRILKKYPNRRLYDTEISSYITLTEVKAMVLAGTAFEVRDAKTGDDLTRSILLQIILEEESGGVPMFSTSMLAQIIRFYGHAMQGMMGCYLEKNLQTFTDVQARLAEQSKGLLDPRLQSPEMWAQLLSGQAPMVQNLMGNYLEQSRQVFMQMQEQLNKQAEAVFPAAGARRREAMRALQAAAAGALTLLAFASTSVRRGGRQAGCCRRGQEGRAVRGTCRVGSRRGGARSSSRARSSRARPTSPRSPGTTTPCTSGVRSWKCKVPRQHAWTIDWTNLARFPALKTAAARARPQRFRFTVTGVDVSSGSPMIPWTTIYRCEVLAVEGVVASAPVVPKRK